MRKKSANRVGSDKHKALDGRESSKLPLVKAYFVGTVKLSSLLHLLGVLVRKLLVSNIGMVYSLLATGGCRITLLLLQRRT